MIIFLSLIPASYITHAGLINPYFLFVLLNIIFLFIFKKLKINEYIKLISLTLLLSFLFFNTFVKSDFSFFEFTIFNFLASYFYYLSIKDKSINSVIKILLLYCFFWSLLCIGDGIVRYTNPFKNIASFYSFKLGGFLFGNSNVVGSSLVCTFATLLSVKDSICRTDYRSFYRPILFLIFFATILSLSRASILTIIVLAFFSYTSKYKFRFVLYLLVLLIILFAVVYFLGDDGSFNSKFDIIYNAKVFFNHISINDLIFGNLNYIYFASKFDIMLGHIHIVDILFRNGLLGIFFFLLIVLFSLRFSNSFLFFWLAFILVGFSSIRTLGHYWMYSFVFIFILNYESKFRNFYSNK